MTTRFMRTTIFCANLEVSLALYRDLLGFKVVEEKQLTGPAAGGLLQLPSCTMRIVLLAVDVDQDPVLGLFEITGVELKSLPTPTQLTLGQCAFVVETDAFEALHGRLVEAEVRFLRTPVQYPKPTASKHSPAGLYREMIFHDPDGVLVSVMQITPLGEPSGHG